MSMSRKDYNEIAEAIASVRDQHEICTVPDCGGALIADAIARDVAAAIRRAGNTNLNTQRFLTACGVEGTS